MLLLRCVLSLVALCLLVPMATATAAAAASSGDGDADGSTNTGSSSSSTSSGNVGCYDDNGNPVDWWAIIKFPSSYSYSIITSSSTSWANGITTIDQSSGAAYNTLQAIYGNSADSYVMWNDETPSGTTSFTYGHSKAVAATGPGGNGFFLTHSIPKYPPPQANGYGIESNAQYFGQSMMCISVSTTTINDLAALWFYANPQIYSSNIGSDSASLPNLQSLVSASFTAPTGTQSLQISTLGGLSMTYFGKSASWNNDIYEFLIAPNYQVNLIAETWTHSSDALGTWCESNSYSYSVQEVTYVNVVGTSWSQWDDHSKWCVSPSSASSSVICIADINRVSTQYTRSGGALCTENSSPLYAAFSQLVQSTGSCSGSSYDAVENNDDSSSSSPSPLKIVGGVVGATALVVIAVVIVGVVLRATRKSKVGGSSLGVELKQQQEQQEMGTSMEQPLLPIDVVISE